MTGLSIRQASDVSGVSRQRITAALKSGQMSGTKDGRAWRVDPSELERVFPTGGSGNGAAAPDPAPDASASIRAAVAEARVEMLEAALDREASTVADLRARLDRADARILALSPPADPPARDGVARRIWRALFA